MRFNKNKKIVIQTGFYFKNYLLMELDFNINRFTFYFTIIKIKSSLLGTLTR